MNVIIDIAAIAAGMAGSFVAGNQYSKWMSSPRPSGSKYGYLPDLPDIRDYIYLPSVFAEALPSTVNLETGMGPVLNQGALGSCTANAIAGAVLYELVKSGKATNNLENTLSRLFIYFNERNYEGNPNVDGGAFLRDGIKMVAKYGVPKETLWPYKIQRFSRKPRAAAYDAAQTDIIKKYSRLTTSNSRIKCLAAGFPFVAGFTAYTEFESKTVAQSGIVPSPGPGSVVVGGHAIVVMGYDKTKGTYLCRNSWGADWGQSGNFTIPFDYLDNRNLSDDHWVINA